MLRRIACASTLLAILGTASIASADSYVSLGIGGDPALQGDIHGAVNGTGDGGNGRLALGMGVGRVSVEGSLSRFGLGTDQATSAGVHLRLVLPLDGNFGAYGRVGLEHLWLGDTGASLGKSTSDGIAGAIGLQYTLHAPLLGEAGLWAELSQDRFNTGGGTTSTSGSTMSGSSGVRLWTAGLTVGL